MCIRDRIFFVTYLLMLFVATSSFIYLLAGTASGAAAAVAACGLFSHVQKRVAVWRNPWSDISGSGYQIAQSLFAVGTGGWFGMGLYQGMPKSIPVVEKDFMLSLIHIFPKFTLVGATTRAGLLTAPLRDRFGIVQKMEFYTPADLKEIVLRSAKVLGVEIDEQGAWEIGRRSRGTPRLANRLLKRVRDFAQVKYDGVITLDVANFALDILDVDKMGLDNDDRNILLTVIQKFSGGPVGLDLSLIHI